MEGITSAVGLISEEDWLSNRQKYQEEETPGSSFGAAFEEAVQAQASGEVSMDAIFEEAASTYGISVDLLKAVAKAESNFNPNAVSSAGAMGVMQLMPGTASSLGVTDPFDARQNIMGGAKYLKSNLEKYNGDVSLTLAAYNAGPGSVQKYGGIPPYAETQNYVKKVISYMDGADLATGKMVKNGSYSSASALGDLYGSTSSSALGMLGMSALTGGSGLYGSSALSGYGTSSLSGLGSSYGTSALAGLGSLSGTSALTGMGSLFGMSSVYGASTDMLSLLFGSAVQDSDGETVTMKKESFYNLMEILRMQMMMNSSSQVGLMDL